MNFHLVIVREKTFLFSKFITNSPKMLTALKEKCEEYKRMFDSEFTVRRVLLTKAGYKFI